MIKTTAKLSILITLITGLCLAQTPTQNSIINEDLLAERIAKKVEKRLKNNNTLQQIDIDALYEEFRVRQAAESTVKLPQKQKWYDKMKFFADFRYRLQSEKHELKDYGRERQRIRFRFGFEASIYDISALNTRTDDLFLGARFATAGYPQGDPRSTNDTMGPTMYPTTLMLDRAYLKYIPFKSFYQDLTLYAGKYGNKFYTISSLLWDSDLNFEGISMHYNRYQSKRTEFFLNSGYWQLYENKNEGEDPKIIALQPGFTYKLTTKISLEAAYAIWQLPGVEDNDSFTAGSGFDGEYNTTDNLKLANGINTREISTKLIYKRSADSTIQLLYQQVVNQAAEVENTGFLVGAKIGNFKVKKTGDWQLSWEQRRLERDAFLDVFPDSDVYGGHTGVNGQSLSFTIGLRQNVKASIKNIQSDLIDEKLDTGYSGSQDLWQFDVNVKF